MLEAVSESLGIAQKNFSLNEILQSEKYVQGMADFFQGRGSRKLYMFFQCLQDETIQKDLMTEQNFLVSFDKVIPLKSKAVYMLRIAEDGVPINMNELGSDIMYGEISP